MTYEEAYSFPDELLGKIDNEVVDYLFDKSLWCLKGYGEGLEVAMIFSIMPDQNTAVLEYIYGIKDSVLTKELLEESKLRLQKNSINRLLLVLNPDKCNDVLKEEIRVRINDAGEEEHYRLLKYSYRQIREASICEDLNMLKAFTQDVDSIMNPESPEALDVRDILEENSIFTSAYEQHFGIGKFCLDDEKTLLGVLLARIDTTGNVVVGDYQDNLKRGNLQILRKLMLSVIVDYLEYCSSDSSIEFVCQNDMMLDFVKSCFGEEESTEDVVYHSVLL